MLPENHKRIPVDWVMDGVAAHIKHILDEFLVLLLACILQGVHCDYRGFVCAGSIVDSY